MEIAAAASAIASGATIEARTAAPKRDRSPAPIACAPTIRSAPPNAHSPTARMMKTLVAALIAASAAVPRTPTTIVSAIPKNWSATVATALGAPSRHSVPRTLR